MSWNYMSNVNQQNKIRGFHLFLPNRGQNKDTIYLSPPPPPSCFLHELFLIFTNFLLRTPLFQLDFLHSGLLVLALYHDLSPLTIFFVTKLSLLGAAECFPWENFLWQAFNCRPGSKRQWWEERQEEQLQMGNLSICLKYVISVQ